MSIEDDEIKQLIETLKTKSGFEAVDHSARTGQVRLMGRVSPNHMNHWKVVMHYLLAQSGANWKVDISKNYFLRSNKVFFAWRIIVSGDKAGFVLGFTQAVKASPSPSRVDIMEVPLVGAHKSRNEGKVFAGGTVPISKIRR